MANPVSHSADGKPISTDIFLSVQTKRAGKIKGEVTTEGHVDEIKVNGWHWGVAASTAIGTTVATARRQYAPLVVTKDVDAASTSLLSALSSNDEVKEAKLTMRKAGGEALDYYVMTLGGARITEIELSVDHSSSPIEIVKFAYTKIEIEYKRQQGTGISGASSSFSDEILPTA